MERRSGVELLKIFISYSHKDAKDKEKLQTHLGVLKSIAPVETWTDTRIGAGQTWRAEIDKALDEAAVAVLLITANFLTSEFINAKEVPEILGRRKTEGLSVFPIIGRPCPWKIVPWLEAMQVRPKDAQPVWRSGARYVDDELTQITYEVAEAVETATVRRKLESERASRDEQALAEQALAAERQKVEAEVRQNRIDLVEYAAFGLVSSPTILAREQEREMERLKIMAETQEKIFEIQQRVLKMRADAVDRAARKWDELISGSG